MLLAAGLAVGMTLSAAAQQPTPEQISTIRASCRSDFISHCAGVQPGTRDALECLKRNSAKVSSACKSALDAVSPRPTESAAPAPAKAAAAPPPPPETAEPPAASSEPGAPPAPGPVAAEGKHPPSHIAAIRAACRADFGVHCRNVRPGGSAALRCLEANAVALSPPCRNAVTAMGEAGAPPAAAPPPLAPLGPIPPMRPRRALEILSFCGAEQRMLCASVMPGGGRILECLATNYARLSPECYGALARATR
jgi:hypothetical protein